MAAIRDTKRNVEGSEGPASLELRSAGDRPIYVSEIVGQSRTDTTRRSTARWRLPVGWYDAGVAMLIIATIAAFLVSLIGSR